MINSYKSTVFALIDEIDAINADGFDQASDQMVQAIAEDRLIYVYGPGGHANLASQEAFFRAGGLMNISAILDEGTLLSGGALRSLAMERTPGYGRVVIDNSGLTASDVIIIVNSYGMNSAVIDSAMRAREVGATIIGVTSRRHAETIGPDHPSRHPTKQNLHDIVDIFIDSCVPVGDAVVSFDGDVPNAGPVSTFANTFIINSLQILAIGKCVERGVKPAVWTSANAPGGDEANAKLIAKFRQRVRYL